jgi:alkylhydroperoxidase family enzyme
MTNMPMNVSETLFSELKKHFNESQLVELTAAIAWENYRARFNHAFGIESQGFSEKSYCVLPNKTNLSVKA